MERFAIKIDKSVKARLKNLCRLCGIDNPNQIEILNAAEWIDLTIEGEVSMSRKIAECVGIEVMKNDRMPQRICALCVDKINDFYEFREMCQATNIQTRKLLNIPDPTKVKATKKVTIKTDEDAVESILGISGIDVKPSKPDQVQKTGKKSKKAMNSATATATAIATTSHENRFRGMTKREIEITLELERIKKEDEEEKKAMSMPVSRTKNGKKKKEKGKDKSDTALLAPKEPNQRERKREMEQKRIEKKRKADPKLKAPMPKKIKREPGVLCLLCEQRFEKVSIRDAHLQMMHRPTIADYGCATCHEQFSTLEENTAHNEWHWKSNIPHKCCICNATYQKLMLFQNHISVCVHPSFTSIASCAGNIYCSLCNLEFETQNLYDWHSCFIGDNSPCPQCQRIFLRRAVLLKHMFKCTGMPAVTAPAAVKKTTKGKAKKKTAKSFQKTKNNIDITPQNSFKFEPETIIDQNVEGDDAFDAVDNSFMDTHFADSDNEFEPNNSIITPDESASQNSPTKESGTNVEPITSNDGQHLASVTSTIGIRANLDHPLLECHVKLEPLDVSSFPVISAQPGPALLPTESLPPPVALAAGPPPSRPTLTVPPLTIRIKKEVIRPGYGDEFDINLASNIKQEKVDETYELAGTSAHRHDGGAHKKSKNREKQKKLYKKPALLAIKIKQERMEREANDDEYTDTYHDYSMPADDFNMTGANQPFENNPLPIITQIHSVIEPSSIIPMTGEQSSDPVKQLLTTPQTTVNIPFVPIRIKSEFQRPLSPPPVTDSASEQPEDNVATTITAAATTNTFEEVASTMGPQMVHSEANEHVTIDKPPKNGVEPQQTEYDTSYSLDGDVNLPDPTAVGGASVDTDMADASGGFNENKTTELVTKMKSSQISEIVDSTQPLTFCAETATSDEIGDKEIVLPQNDVSCEKQPEVSSEEQPSSSNGQTAEDELLENGDYEQNAVTTKLMAEDDTIENVERVDSITHHSIDLSEQLDDFSSMDSKEHSPKQDDEENEQLLEPIKPICDVAMDGDITNDNSAISPIDFIEPNTNDESLNFIDQLVHEVADTMVPPTDDDNKVLLHTDAIPMGSTTIPFDATSFNYSVGCSLNSAVDNQTVTGENSSTIIEDIEKRTTVNNTLLALSDIPEIDCDLLPVMNATESSTEPKSNGSEMNARLPVRCDSTADEDIDNLIHIDAITDNDQPKLPLTE